MYGIETGATKYFITVNNHVISIFQSNTQFCHRSNEQAYIS